MKESDMICTCNGDLYDNVILFNRCSFQGARKNGWDSAGQYDHETMLDCWIDDLN